MGPRARKVELKNFKHNETMSEETDCFSATIYIDDVKVGEVSNRGHGGCNDYDAAVRGFDLEDALADIAIATLSPEDTEFEAADALINELVQYQLVRKDAARYMRTKINYTIAGKEGVFQTKTYPADKIRAWTAPAKLGATMLTLKASHIYTDVDELTKVLAAQAKADMIARRTS